MKFFWLVIIIVLIGFLPFSFGDTDPETGLRELILFIVSYCENVYSSDAEIDECILNEFYFQHIIDYYKFLIKNQNS